MRLEEKVAEERTLKDWLFNPFKYIAGFESFLIGALVIVLTGYLASFSNTHFDGVLDTHSGLVTPWWCYFAEGGINWLCMVVVLLVFGKIASKSSFRLIDLMGTQALARWPLLITAFVVLSEEYGRFTKYLMWQFAGQGEKIPFAMQDAIVFGIVVLVMIMMTCWMVYLMYKSYSVSCNLRGGRAVGTFVGGLILAEIISKVAMVMLLVPIQYDDSWKPLVEDQSLPSAIERDYQYVRHFTFDDDEGIEKINGDKGLTADVENGEFRIHGTTTDREWGPDAVKIRIDDEGGDLDISGKFRLAQKTGSGLIFIEAETETAGPIIMMYQWHWLFKAYQIQDRWFKQPAKIVNGRKNFRSQGNEEDVFNKMRIHVRADRRKVDLFVNEEYFDTIEFEESFGNIVSAKMELQSPIKDADFDIRFDDLIIQWDESPVEKQRSEMEEKTGGLILHYTFDQEGDKVEDVSGQICHGDIIGAPRWVDGVQGKALAFDGTNDCIKIPLPKRMRHVHKNNFTFMAWVCANSSPDDKAGQGILVKPGCDVGLVRDDRGVFRISRYYETAKPSSEKDDNWQCVWMGKNPSDLHRWYHLAGVVSDGGKMTRLYINGHLVVQQEQDDLANVTQNEAPWFIGACDGRSMRWPAHGIIDEVRMYNRALAAEELKAIFDEVDSMSVKQTP